MADNRFRWLVAVALLSPVAAALAQAQNGAAPGATLRISGDIPAPVTLTLGDLAALPHESAPVTAEDGTKSVYDGVPLREILARAGAPFGKQLRGKNMTTFVLATAHDGYQVVFTLAELDTAFANEGVLVADKHEGKPMSAPLGPLRIVCVNDKAGARSLRMLETLEVVRVRK
jgi:DMSO/TMAO reductase YedYZ molybdopterin-dependent catalytic subunit